MGWVLHASPRAEAESQYPTIIAICVVLSIISIAGVGSRLWIRYTGRGLEKDDWMAALSAGFALTYAILCIAQTRYGLGLPISSRPAKSLVIYTRVNYAGRPVYQVGVSFFKLALLISYLRLLQGTNHKTYRRIVYFAILTVFVSHLACAFCLIFACDPVQKSWEPLMKGGRCLAPGPSFTAYAFVTIVSDIVVAALPVPMLLALNIPTEKKIGLVGIFALGLFTTLCSVFRYLQINRIQFGDGNSTMLILWGVIEFNVGNLVSSLPFLAPIFIKKTRGYRSKQSSGNGSSGSWMKWGKGSRWESKGAYKLSDRRQNQCAFGSADDSSLNELGCRKVIH
ncbi:integral membrane protein [Geosmithia morbida]|uniref:Integral membrane protein n=1 Tax=Geosmithia morbida TaxID=1094350 RepID=A0A9P5CZ67_9HYPO|nr:uncharacterized protein GMORB2_3249 [Geosmithia morbida]KAF4120122.1 integral membrane protein [Geosmithia morbida]